MEKLYIKENLKEIMTVMQKIQDLQFFTKENNYLRYIVFDFFNIKKEAMISSIKEDEILGNINKWGVISIENTDKEYEEIDHENNRVEITNIILYLKILPKFKDFYNELKTLNEKENSKLICKKDGLYFFNNELIEIDSKSKYYSIFDIIFLGTDQEGFISYETIIKQMKLRGLNISNNNKANIKSINNLIINEQHNFFYYARVNNKKIENKTPDEIPIMKVIRGKGVKFYNPNLI